MKRERIGKKVSQLLASVDLYAKMSQKRNPYGDGQSAKNIVEFLNEIAINNISNSQTKWEQQKWILAKKSCTTGG